LPPFRRNPQVLYILQSKNFFRYFGVNKWDVRKHCTAMFICADIYIVIFIYIRRVFYPPRVCLQSACGGPTRQHCVVAMLYVFEVNWIFLYLCSTLWGATFQLPPKKTPATPHLAAGKSCLNAALASIKNNIPQRTLLNYTILTVKQQPAPQLLAPSPKIYHFLPSCGNHNFSYFM